ncbi:MAG: gamma-glutamylcyclotransferase [Isosphaerales bacterium]
MFAYGTLMPRDQEAVLRQGWTPDAVRGRLYDLGPYPALIDLDDPTAGWVEGYVRSVEPAELERHDVWEDVAAGVYRRALTTTRNENHAWIYVYARPLPGHARGPFPLWSAPAVEERA